MTRKNSGAGAASTDPAPTITAAPTPQDRCHGSASPRLPVAIATAVPPLGRRRLWLLLVEACPHCTYAHVHRAAAAIGGARAGGCGRTYYVRVARAQGRTAA